MHKIVATLLLSSSMMLVSCDEFLDVDSPTQRQTETFYSTPIQAEQALLGVYNGLLPLSTYYMMMSDLRSDDVWAEPAEDKQRDYVDIALYNPNLYMISTINNAWNDLFAIVARANLFIEKMDGLDWPIQADGIDIKQSFVAEARFLRALAYFDLVRFFGRVPLSLHSMTSEQAITTPQAEAIAIYNDAIIPDLEFAIDNLGENAYTHTGGVAVGRANVVAAKALLGRVYITMAGFPLNQTAKLASAAELLMSVIDYADAKGRYWAKSASEWPYIWTSERGDNNYHIFEIQYVAEKNYGNPMVFYATPNVEDRYFEMSGYKIYCDDALQALYQQYPQDIRYRWTVDPAKNYFCKFYESKSRLSELGLSDLAGVIVDRTYFPINYPLIRLEDVMLMYAEIAGPTAEAVTLVDRIRIRAGLPELTAEEKGAEAFAQMVDGERRRELAFEGVRWHDLVRHNDYVELVREKYMRQACDENGKIIRPAYLNYINNIQSYSYIYPIPDAQMKAKVGLYTQNEGY